MNDWIHTRRGVTLVEGTLPKLARALEALTVEVKRLNDSNDAAAKAAWEAEQAAKAKTEPGYRLTPQGEQAEGHVLPLHYGDEPKREREVAAFLRNTDPEPGDDREWLYFRRGPVSQVLKGLRWPLPTAIPGTALAHHPEENIQLCLNDNGFRDSEYRSEYRTDSPDLCWGGPRITVQEFRRWHKEVK